MRTRSNSWKQLAAKGLFTFQAKAVIGNQEYTEISAPKIDRQIMTSPLSVGNCASGTLSLSIRTTDAIPLSAPIKIMGRLVRGNVSSEWMSFGTFFIDQRDTSYVGLVTVSCYDAMLKANQKYLPDNTDTSGWPKTMLSVVEEIAYRIGVAVDPRTKIRTGADYTVPAPTGKTMAQVLGSIGACHGGNWVITDENRLRLIPLITSPDETYHILSDDFEDLVDDDGNAIVYDDQTAFNTQLPSPTGTTPTSLITSDATAIPGYGMIRVPVVCGQLTKGDAITVTGVQLSSESGEKYFAGNENGVVLKIDSNPYATQGICNNLLTAYGGLVYAPYTATKCIYDPAVEPGDQVVIGDMVCSVVYNTALTLDLNYRSDIGAPNSAELTAEYPYLSETAQLQQATDDLAESARTAAYVIWGGGSNNQSQTPSAETPLTERVAALEAAIADLESRLSALED